MKIEDDSPSRAEALKAKRTRPGQFRLAGMFVAMCVAAAFMAVPRLVDVEYGWFFGFWYMVIFACAPMFAWAVAGFVPWLKRRGLVATAIVSFLLAAIPGFLLIVWMEDFIPAMQAMFVLVIWFWLPQIICIVVTWCLLFRDPPKRKQMGSTE